MDLVEQLLAGNRRALARVISQVEDGTDTAQGLLAALYGHTGRAHVIGITGPPGSGKSTLVNTLARAYRATGKTIGIIAVDPTSPFSGGALLGDRVRMRDLAGDPGIFIRSMATRGSLGGLARTTADVLSVIDAAGFDRILIETVGVGQAEIDIANGAYHHRGRRRAGLGDGGAGDQAGVLEMPDIACAVRRGRPGRRRSHRRGAAHDAGVGRTDRRPPAATVRLARPAEAGEQPDSSWLPRSSRRSLCAGKASKSCATGSSGTGPTCAAPGSSTSGKQDELERWSRPLRDPTRDPAPPRLPPGQLDNIIGAINAARWTPTPRTASWRPATRPTTQVRHESDDRLQSGSGAARRTHRDGRIGAAARQPGDRGRPDLSPRWDRETPPPKREGRCPGV